MKENKTASVIQTNRTQVEHPKNKSELSQPYNKTQNTTKTAAVEK